MDNIPPFEESSHEAYLAYIKAGIISLGLIFFGACLWEGKLEATVCVLAIVALLNQYTSTPIELGSVVKQVRAYQVGLMSRRDPESGEIRKWQR